MPKNTTIQSILVIGSGPIVIGQAAEFDYSGTQGCRALKEEGYKVILVNNNPATIMTDEVNADVVYFEPLTVTSLEKIIQKEKPDGLIGTLGGQTGLTLTFQLHEAGVLSKYNVKLLGTPIDSIKKGEDREEFRQLMNDLEEPVPESQIVHTVDEALLFAEEVGFPLIIRPAYTLGGSGGGIAETLDEYKDFVKGGLDESPITQCLIERSIAGFKEIEYEVMRDQNDTCITICNMENIDPVGVHTGDSIVVAPSQTLTDVEYQMLRSASIKIISALGIIGGCNIQFALDPTSKKYYLIEVNPRVSRSSALASKATGYPIAKIAAKLAVGYTLDEIINPVTGGTYASFEPALDYVVVKFPRFPFDKFPAAEQTLGTQMKATGEVMAIDTNLERAIQKAVSSLESDNVGISLKKITMKSDQELLALMKKGSESRFFAIIELLRRGIATDVIHEESAIDLFFLNSFQSIVQVESELKAKKLDEIDVDFMEVVKEKGFTDGYIATLLNESEFDVRAKRKALGVIPSYRMVDTCAAEFQSQTPYFYSSYFGKSEVEPSDNEKVLIIGSGPIRIGQGIEFDYSSVHGILALQEEGYETILINNNPETVSTDFEIADRLYFEPLTLEDVLNVIEAENVSKVLVQYGGQTAINLAKDLEKAGLTLLGITSDVIDQLEDRDRFYQLLEGIEVPHLPGKIAMNQEELITMAKELGFPILIRPSYVIGGKGMVVMNDESELVTFMEKQIEIGFPILIDAYAPGMEFEIDLIADGKSILIPTIVEHVEKAGVHSGDSHAILPAVSLGDHHKKLIEEYAQKITNSLDFVGLMNIQFVYHNDKIFVLEVNPRASRTVPVVSKVTGIPMVQLATKLLLGNSLQQLVTKTGLLDDPPFFTAKFPVFSSHKIGGDPLVGPEMKSTGEGISIAETVEEAFIKVFHQYLEGKPEATSVYIDQINSFPEHQLTEIVSKLKELGLQAVMDEDATEWLKSEKTLAYFNLGPTQETSIYRILASKNRIQVFTNIELISVFLQALTNRGFSVRSIQEWKNKDYLKKEVNV
ncbi:carbamoyl phosphate synthase large subunit [Litchfieldia salsa]|uniref:Carbamoyl phosphate synthase large chain n=1 Tax=Litchfieldia salsa TaxID=930152 RepID=A0A1H0S7B0_9BACI|nr:carbamoyl phosphate synthase large subunit [Litchfieldia salsa]SDP37662.1 carbamoyl-phosphate synthase large subunit [Litchfieldia salsa]